MNDKHPISKICPTCGCSFYVPYRWKKYCSKDCYRNGKTFLANYPEEKEKLHLSYLQNHDTNNPAYQNGLIRYKKQYALLRKEASKTLGDKCVYCGCDIPTALEFNHINGGGRKEQKVSKNGVKFFKSIISGERTDIELACKICNSVHYMQKLRGLGNHWKVVYNN